MKKFALFCDQIFPIRSRSGFFYTEPELFCLFYTARIVLENIYESFMDIYWVLFCPAMKICVQVMFYCFRDICFLID